jgi:hypothetical protein
MVTAVGAGMFWIVTVTESPGPAVQWRLMAAAGQSAAAETANVTVADCCHRPAAAVAPIPSSTVRTKATTAAFAPGR